MHCSCQWHTTPASFASIPAHHPRRRHRPGTYCRASPCRPHSPRRTPQTSHPRPPGTRTGRRRGPASTPKSHRAHRERREMTSRPGRRRRATPDRPHCYATGASPPPRSPVTPVCRPCPPERRRTGGRAGRPAGGSAPASGGCACPCR
uniref:Uncharacterized protein n=1 Tax=Arundo donax TaxID=35708 RepID=A0A0A9D408_ARUDO